MPVVPGTPSAATPGCHSPRAPPPWVPEVSYSNHTPLEVSALYAVPVTPRSPHETSTNGWKTADCKKEDEEWQMWLTRVLDEHRERITNDIREQLQVLAQSTALGDPSGEFNALAELLVGDANVPATPDAGRVGECQAAQREDEDAEDTEPGLQVQQTWTQMEEHHHDLHPEKKPPHKCNKWLDALGAVAIISNTIAMMVELQWSGYEARVALGLISRDGAWHLADWWFWILEHVFNVVFTFELAARIFLHRCRFFYDPSNLLDVLLVTMTSLQLYILQPLAYNSIGGKVIVFRLLRFGRMIRVMRMVRVMRLFTELRILVQTFISSMRALLWSMIFIFLIMLISALFLCFSLQDYIRDETNSYDHRLWVYDNYGSAAHSLLTLFEATMSGCWPRYFRPLIDTVSKLYVVFVVAYISVVVFATTRIITALFLKETLAAASADAESQAIELAKRKRAVITRLRHVFETVDISGDGKLELEEFSRIVRNEEVVVLLKMLELEVQNAEGLFMMMDTSGSGEITFEEFLQGVQRLKGQARSTDVVAMLRAHDLLQRDLKELKGFVVEIHECVAKARKLSAMSGSTRSMTGVTTASAGK